MPSITLNNTRVPLSDLDRVRQIYNNGYVTLTLRETLQVLGLEIEYTELEFVFISTVTGRVSYVVDRDEINPWDAMRQLKLIGNPPFERAARRWLYQHPTKS